MLQVRVRFTGALCALALGLIPGLAVGQTTTTVGTQTAPTTATAGSAYPNVCVVSGEELGSMGEAHTIQHNGRTVKFCCKSCEKQFQADPEKYLKKLDETIISQQSKNYSSNVCVVSGKEMAPGTGKEIVVNNQLVRICCGGCEATVRADPDKYLNKLSEPGQRVQGGQKAQ